jgi:hypothetical protein
VCIIIRQLAMLLMLRDDRNALTTYVAELRKNRDRQATILWSKTILTVV